MATGVLQVQENPFVGTWKLNVANAKVVGSLKVPQSETMTVVAQGLVEKVTYDGIAADGSPISYSYTTNLDGKDSPVSGAPSFDTVAVTRVDVNTHTSVAKKAGKTVRTTRSAVSKDGKVMTVTGQGMNAQGWPISFTGVYDKQ